MELNRRLSSVKLSWFRVLKGTDCGQLQPSALNHSKKHLCLLEIIGLQTDRKLGLNQNSGSDASMFTDCSCRTLSSVRAVIIIQTLASLNVFGFWTVDWTKLDV